MSTTKSTMGHPGLRTRDDPLITMGAQISSLVQEEGLLAQGLEWAKKKGADEVLFFLFGRENTNLVTIKPTRSILSKILRRKDEELICSARSSPSIRENSPPEEAPVLDLAGFAVPTSKPAPELDIPPPPPIDPAPPPIQVKQEAPVSDTNPNVTPTQQGHVVSPPQPYIPPMPPPAFSFGANTTAMSPSDKLKLRFKEQLGAHVASLISVQGRLRSEVAADVGISEQEMFDLTAGRVANVSVDKMLDILVHLGVSTVNLQIQVNRT